MSLFSIKPDHSDAIKVLSVLSHRNTGYCPTAIRFGLRRYSHHGSVYVELTTRNVLRYITTCAEGKALLETFFGPNHDYDCKGYRRWCFPLQPGVKDRVAARMKYTYDNLKEVA